MPSSTNNPPQPSASDLSTTLQPFLSSIPTAPLPSPPPTTLPHLTPIQRQRVKLLASPDSPWLSLISPSDPETLIRLAQHEAFEPHPVSGEVELDLDWSSPDDVDVSFRRRDEETLECVAEFHDLAGGLWIRLVHCPEDTEGDVHGWRVAEVGCGSWEGDDMGDCYTRLEDAERNFREEAEERAKGQGQAAALAGTGGAQRQEVHTIGQAAHDPRQDEEEDDDADYWAQYDATPSQTPGPQQSSSKPSPAPVQQVSTGDPEKDAENAYFAQYGTVQPAMDGHDPDEAEGMGELGGESSLGVHHSDTYERPAAYQSLHLTTSQHGASSQQKEKGEEKENEPPIFSPRPHSSSDASDGGQSDTVRSLEEAADRMSGTSDAADTAIRQHIGASIKSLYRLARAAGMSGEEVREVMGREVECLGFDDA